MLARLFHDLLFYFLIHKNTFALHVKEPNLIFHISSLFQKDDSPWVLNFYRNSCDSEVLLIHQLIKSIHRQNQFLWVP